MPNDPMYSAMQINIPPELPDILKQFTKAAIRTQPKDILQVKFFLVLLNVLCIRVYIIDFFSFF